MSTQRKRHLAGYKTLIVSFAGLFVLMIGVIGGVVYFSAHSLQDSRQAGPGIQRDSGQPVRITGFQFDHSAEGKKIIRIKADELTVEKMKLGHFSLGIANVAKLKNGVVEMYADLAIRATPPTSGEASRAESNPGGGALKDPAVSFSSLFKEESMPSFGGKKVASIVIEPIQLRVYDRETVLTDITASTANLKLRNREIQFKGAVRLSSNQRVLEAEEMSFHPETGTINVEGDYVLDTADGKFQGKRLEADLLLRERKTGSSKHKN